jgi:iron complex outermembrane receptor protein
MAFLSRFDSEEFARGYRVKLDATKASAANLTTTPDGSVTGGVFTRNSGSATRVELVNDDNQDFDEVASFGLGGEWNISDNWSMTFDLSHSSASSDFRNGLLWSLVAEDATADVPVFDENVQIVYQNNGLNLPDVGFSQADAFSDINRVMVSVNTVSIPIKMKMKSMRSVLDFKYRVR